MVHTDHTKYIPQYLKYGIPIYSCSEVVSRYPKVNVLEPMKKYKIGNFEVMGLLVPHSVENYAYYIFHPNMGKMIFATDCHSFPWNLKGINFIAIEANYDEGLIIDRLCDNEELRGSNHEHMAIGETINVINRLKSADLCKTILIHLSDANSDEKLFEKRVRTECGVRADCAKSSDVFLLNCEDF